MSGVTFGAWLEHQARNQPDGDPIGELARHWLKIKGSQRVRALPSIEAKLREAGAFDAGWQTAWDAAVAAYRGQRTGSLASGDLRMVPPITETDESTAAVSATFAHPAGPVEAVSLEGIQATLDAHTKFLAAIAVQLGLSATRVQEIAAQTFGGPMQWPAMAAAADFSVDDEVV